MAHVASAHFVIHSNIKYWEQANISWSLTNYSLIFIIIFIIKNKGNPFKAHCADMAITSFYNSETNPTAFIVICPLEGQSS